MKSTQKLVADLLEIFRVRVWHLLKHERSFKAVEATSLEEIRALGEMPNLAPIDADPHPPGCLLPCFG